MIENRRTYFNTHFTINAYQNMLNQIEQEFPNELDFRLAETPVFCGTVITSVLIKRALFISIQREHNSTVLSAEQSSETISSIFCQVCAFALSSVSITNLAEL
jgi:hypothetical protein